MASINKYKIEDAELLRQKSIYNINEFKYKSNSNTNNILRKVMKTGYIFKRAVINNSGKIVIFLILISILFILITEYKIPIDGSYAEDTNISRFLSFINILIISILVAGTISIFNIENEITKDRSENKDQIFCKYHDIINILNYNYILEPLIEHPDVINILTEYPQYKLLFRYNLLESHLNELNILEKKFYSNDTDATDSIKSIIYDKLILNYLLYDIFKNDIKLSIIFNKNKDLLKRLDIENYTNILLIKNEIIENMNKIYKGLESKKDGILENMKIFYNDYFNLHIKKDEINSDDIIKKNINVLNLLKHTISQKDRDANITINLIINNNLPLDIEKFNILLNKIDNNHINNLFNKLENSCKSALCNF